MKSRLLTLSLLALITLVFIGGGLIISGIIPTTNLFRASEQSETTKQTTSDTTNQPYPPFLEFRDQIVIATAVSLDCTACAGEIEALSLLASDPKYESAAFFVVNHQDSHLAAQRLLTANDSLGTLRLRLDNDGLFYQSISAQTMPETVVYDQGGEVVAHFRGPLNEIELRNTLDALVYE